MQNLVPLSSCMLITIANSRETQRVDLNAMMIAEIENCARRATMKGLLQYTHEHDDRLQSA